MSRLSAPINTRMLPRVPIKMETKENDVETVFRRNRVQITLTRSDSHNIALYTVRVVIQRLPVSLRLFTIGQPGMTLRDINYTLFS